MNATQQVQVLDYGVLAEHGHAMFSTLNGDDRPALHQEIFVVPKIFLMPNPRLTTLWRCHDVTMYGAVGLDGSTQLTLHCTEPRGLKLRFELVD